MDMQTPFEHPHGMAVVSRWMGMRCVTWMAALVNDGGCVGVGVGVGVAWLFVLMVVIPPDE